MRKTVVKGLTKFLFLRIVGKPTTLQEIRMTFYRVIIMNMFWTDSDLPNNLEEKFEFRMNPSWETSSKPKNSRGLRGLSEEMLIYLSSRFEQPKWVESPKAPKLNMSLNEIAQQWPFLFDLGNEQGTK